MKTNLQAHFTLNYEIISSIRPKNDSDLEYLLLESYYKLMYWKYSLFDQYIATSSHQPYRNHIVMLFDVGEILKDVARVPRIAVKFQEIFQFLSSTKFKRILHIPSFIQIETKLYVLLTGLVLSAIGYCIIKCEYHFSIIGHKVRPKVETKMTWHII